MLLQGGSNQSRGAEPPGPPHFNHWLHHSCWAYDSMECLILIVVQLEFRVVLSLLFSLIHVLV